MGMGYFHVPQSIILTSSIISFEVFQFCGCGNKVIYRLSNYNLSNCAVDFLVIVLVICLLYSYE